MLTVASSTPSLTTFLGGVTELLTWTLSSMTSVVTWCLGNPLAFCYLGMFISGFVVAYMARVLRSM